MRRDDCLATTEQRTESRRVALEDCQRVRVEQHGTAPSPQNPLDTRTGIRSATESRPDHDGVCPLADRLLEVGVGIGPRPREGCGHRRLQRWHARRVHDGAGHSHAALEGRSRGENRRTGHALGAAYDRNASPRSLVRVDRNPRHARRDPRAIHERCRAIVERGMRAQPDVDDNDASAAIAFHQRATFQRAEGDREIGGHRDVAFACGRIEAARHVERDHARARIAQFANATNGVGDRTTGRAGGAGAQDAVDHDAFGAARLVRVDQRTCGLSLRARIVGFRRGHFDDTNGDSDRRERRRDHPRIATVVSRTGEHRDSVRNGVAERMHDFGGRRGSRALHERSRRDSAIDGGAIASGGLRRGDDMHRHATVVRQNDMAGGGW